jgi:hypothetical protein
MDKYCSPIGSRFFVVFGGGGSTGVGTQRLVLARQVLYYLSHAFSPRCWVLN